MKTGRILSGPRSPRDAGAFAGTRAYWHALVDAMVDRQIDGMILIAPRIPTDELKRIAGYIPTSIIGTLS